MKQHAFFSLGVLYLTIASLNTYSQENEDVENPQEDIEKILVKGKAGDAAMRAFNSGNFELAEIEFKKNAKCALRFERNSQAFVDGLQTAQNNQLTQGAASSSTNSRTGGGLNSGVSSSNLNGNIGGNSRNKSNKPKVRTCNDRGFQLYMTGLSQLKLGRVDEAEKNLKTASFLNKNLYDAHYRLGLMTLLREDTKAAKKQLSKLKAILKRCHECEAEDEIIAQTDFLTKAVNGEIKLK